MPTKSGRRENILIEQFLTSYERGSWAESQLDWLDSKQDSAVEVIATRSDGEILAIEHTLIQPFATEKEDFAYFKKNFPQIEEDQSLIIPGRIIYVYIPAGALQKGNNWDLITKSLHEWLKANILSFPSGRSEQTCPIACTGKSAAGNLVLQVKVNFVPEHEGILLIRRYGEMNIRGVVEKALRDKLPKLVNTVANKRILLLERDQMKVTPLNILVEIKKIRAKFPDFIKVDEIWFVETMYLASDGHAGFELYDTSHELVQTLGFLYGKLIERSENGKPRDR